MPDGGETVAGRDVVLAVRGLRKRYGSLEVVRGLTFEIARGECFGLLGPNGAGKTTTLRCCLGLIDPDGGDITMVGLPVPDAAREARIRVGVVPQMDNLDPDFTVTENLRIYGGYFGIDRATLDARIPKLLEFAGLAGKADAGIRALSGGMKRRLTLARALINDPELLILDEPTTGLDPQARHLIWDGLRQLLSQGKTILLTTHFMDEAEQLANRVAIIDRGRLVALDTPAGLRHAVTHELRFATEPQVSEVEVAAALGLAPDAVERENDGTLVLGIEPSPETVARLTAWLATQGALLTELRAGSRTLEQAFLALTENHQPPRGDERPQP